MEILNNLFSKFIGDLWFGGCSTNKAIKYITVRDIDHS